MMWFANAVAWIATSVGVVAGMYITKSAWCLWAFLIPALMMAEYSNIYTNKENDDEDEENEMVD